MFFGFIFVVLKSLFNMLNIIFLVFVCVIVMLGYGGFVSIVGGK